MEVVEGDSLNLTCVANGYPANYNYSSYIQTWEGKPIPNTNKVLIGHRTYGVFEITSVQLQDSGIYTCTVDNGVKSLQNELVQKASYSIRIKGTLNKEI